MLKGKRIIAPMANNTNKKLLFEIPTGFFLTKTLYVPKQIPAATIHKSPVENRKWVILKISPLVIKNMIPIKPITIPVIFFQCNFSFTKMAAKTVATIG